MKNDSPGRPLARRTFLKQSLALAGAASLPAFIPGRALGRDGTVAPRAHRAGGHRHRPARPARPAIACCPSPTCSSWPSATCGPSRRQAVKAMADDKYGNHDCATYRDMLELLARPDIDAVLIATGDRWHALGSILAMKAGKHVYSEKPCGITIALCQALDDAVRRYGRVFQAGTQRRTISNFQAAVRTGP